MSTGRLGGFRGAAVSGLVVAPTGYDAGGSGRREAWGDRDVGGGRPGRALGALYTLRTPRRGSTSTVTVLSHHLSRLAFPPYPLTPPSVTSLLEPPCLRHHSITFFTTFHHSLHSTPIASPATDSCHDPPHCGPLYHAPLHFTVNSATHSPHPPSYFITSLISRSDSTAPLDR